MNDAHSHRRPDRLLRTGGYILLFLLCAGALYVINRAWHKKESLRITFSEIELDNDGTLRVEGTGEYTTPVWTADFDSVNGRLGRGWGTDDGLALRFGRRHFGGCIFHLDDALLERKDMSDQVKATVDDLYKDEFDPSARSVEIMAKCGETYELHFGDSVVICRVRGKSGAVYERRIEVIDPDSTEGAIFTRAQRLRYPGNAGK
jgi:hypothetical protein